MIVVSHDRAFMDNMVDRVAEIDAGRRAAVQGQLHRLSSNSAKSGWSFCGLQKAKQDEETGPLGGLRGEASATRPTKAKQAQERQKRIDKILENRIVRSLQEKKTVHFNFQQPPRTGDMVVKGTNIVKRFGDKHCLRWAGFHPLSRRQSGAGGAQRRRQIDTVEDDRRSAGPRCGHHRVRRTRGSVTYYAQHQLEELHAGNTVFEELDHVAPGWTISQVRTLLGAFLFSGDAVDKKRGGALWR